MPPTSTKVHNQQQFHQVDQLYQSCFGASSVPTAVQYSWWQKQNHGIIALSEEGAIIGAASLWDISSTAFEKLLAGSIRERDLSPDDLSATGEGFMYLSEVALQVDYRGRGLSYYLLREIMLTIEANYRRFYGEKDLQVLALAYSTGGTVLLQKMGFEKIREAEMTADGLALFCLTIQGLEKS